MRYTVGSKKIETRQDVLFVDGTAVPGESGSPVFLWPGPRLQGGAFTVHSSRFTEGLAALTDLMSAERNLDRVFSLS